jgi:hypothetical protein
MDEYHQMTQVKPLLTSSLGNLVKPVKGSRYLIGQRQLFTYIQNPYVLGNLSTETEIKGLVGQYNHGGSLYTAIGFTLQSTASKI